MTKVIATVAAGLALFGLIGCAPQTLRSARVDAPPPKADSLEAAAVLLFPDKSCAGRLAVDDSETGGGVLGTALIGMGVDFGLNLIGSAIKYAKEGRNAAWYASTVVKVPTAPAIGCLRVLRGEISDASQAPVIETLGEPIFDGYFDMSWVPKDGSLAIQARPYRVSYADTSAPIRGKGRKDVTVMIAFSGQTLQPAADPAAKPATDKASGVIRLDLGRLQTGRLYQRNLLGAVVGGTSMEKPAAGTLTAVVIESEGPSPVLDAFSSAFDSNKGDLAKALKDALGGG